MTALAYRLTGSRDDALDVLQETFIYFFSKFPGMTLTSSMRSFLYPAVKHNSINVLRRRKRTVDLESYRHSGEVEVQLRWIPPEGRRSDFYKMTESLPDGQREVVRLRFGLDFRLEEIAASLDVPLGTVKSRLHNALKTIRKSVERQRKRDAHHDKKGDRP